MPRRTTRAQRRRSKRPSACASNQIDVEKVERRQFDFRDSCFKGPFLVHLCDLDFGQSKNRLIEDGDNVARLTHILSIQGCLRLSGEFHVPVVVDAADWLTKVNSREPTLVRGLRMDQLEYAFELTPKRDHHRRVPRKNKDKERAFSISANEELNGIPSLLLLHHFLLLARGYDFEVPLSEGDRLSETRELPRPHPCDFPPNDNDEVETERRSGKPFTDSVHADRFALSRESLRQNWNFQRVSAGFVRRSVFRAFFSYLNADVAESPH
ncbi:hypothetical protein N7485_003675 [Penicillium canescens]|nr:hypothetical protein N7485_003675 [Penicillium canescens]